MVVVVVDVNVTPTPSNAPDPEQMAGQGLSAEPELIACAMSYCLRPPPPKLPKPPAILIFAPRTPPPNSSPPTPHSFPSFMFYLSFPLYPQLLQALVRFIHSLIHPFTHSRVGSFIGLFRRHSFTGWPTYRGFMAGQLGHLRFQSVPAECLFTLRCRSSHHYRVPAHSYSHPELVRSSIRFAAAARRLINLKTFIAVFGSYCFSGFT